MGRGFQLAPYFNSADGMPLLRDKSTYEIEKGGAYTAGGATTVKTDRSACPGRATLAGTVRDASRHDLDRLPGRRQGRAPPACGRRVELDDAGASGDDVPADTQTLSWVLPTVA